MFTFLQIFFDPSDNTKFCISWSVKVKRSKFALVFIDQHIQMLFQQNEELVFSQLFASTLHLYIGFRFVLILKNIRRLHTVAVDK